MIVTTEVAESSFALPSTITKSDLRAPQYHITLTALFEGLVHAISMVLLIWLSYNTGSVT